MIWSSPRKRRASNDAAVLDWTRCPILIELAWVLPFQTRAARSKYFWSFFLRDIVPINSRAPRAVQLSDPLDTTSDAGRYPTQGTEFTGLHEYFAIAKRRWKLIIAVVILATGYTLNSVRTERPQFRSRATVRLMDASRAMAGNMAENGAATAAQMPFSRSTDPIQSQIQILQSEAVVSMAVDLKGLRLVPVDRKPFVSTLISANVAQNSAAEKVDAYFGQGNFQIASRGQTATAPYGQAATIDGVTLAFSEKPSVPSTSFNVISKESAMSSILRQFSVAARPQTDILDLSFTDYDPWEATRIANAMAEAYQFYNKTNAQQFSRRRLEFLQNQVQQTDAVLNSANSALSAFRAGRESSAAASAVQTANATQIATQRSALDADRQSIEAILAKPHQTPETLGPAVRAALGAPAVAGNPAVQQLYGQLSALQATRDNFINAGAAPTNPDLVGVLAQIRVTGSKIFDAIESQHQSLVTRIEALDRMQGGSSSGIAGTGGGETREAQLEADVQTAQKLAGDLNEELQKAKMSEAIEAGQVEIVQLSRTPGYRIANGAERKLFLGLIVGLMFGFGAAVLADSLDRSIRRRGDIEPLLGVPGLVVIPRLPFTEAAAGVLPALARGSRKAVRLKSISDSPDLVTLTHPTSPSAEAFRTLRTNLMFSHAVTEMRRLVVTSASPSEGKTLTAANLGVSFAQQGLRVLLIDCDLRRGRLHKVFDLQREPGMSDLVLGYAAEEKVIHPTLVPGLYVIPTGKFPPNPAELLGGPRMRATLEKLSEGFDLVIFDSPPLLAASDAAILATISDGAIMVIRAGSTESAAAQQAMQQLNSVRVRVVGAVLNDPEGEVKKYGAYYNYEYQAQGA
jgi:capsular exopolysaccharide synthesis family protein